MKFTKCKPSKKVNSLLKNPYVKPDFGDEDPECCSGMICGYSEKNPETGWCRQCEGQGVRVCNYCCAYASLEGRGEDRHHFNRTKKERRQIKEMIAYDVESSLRDLHGW